MSAHIDGHDLGDTSYIDITMRVSRLLMERTGNRYLAVVRSTHASQALLRLRLGGLHAYMLFFLDTTAWASYYCEFHTT